MWRFFLILCLTLFVIGALSSVVLLFILGAEGEFRQAIGPAIGTLIFSGLAFACRRDLQREQQKREFESESRFKK